MKKILVLICVCLAGLFFFASGHFLSKAAVHKVSGVTSLIPNISPPITNTVGIPKQIMIPRLGVIAQLETVGMDSQGRMDVPKDWQDAAWYSLGYRPGENGSAVIDGHLDTPTGAPAIFWNINKLSPGDIIEVNDYTGKTYTFTVTKTASFPYNQVPLQNIFATHDRPRLNLITCAGTWDKASHNYSNRTVVYAQE